MTTDQRTRSPATTQSERISLLAAVSAGLAAGLLEAAVRIWLQTSGFASFASRLTTVSARLLWVAPLAYVVGFAGLSLAASTISRALGREIPTRMLLAFFATMVWLSPIASTQRLSQAAVILLAAGLGVTVVRLLPAAAPARAAMLGRVCRGLIATSLVVAAGVEAGQAWSESQFQRRLPASRPGAPNILLVIFDTLRADHVTTYGYARNATPSLARLAATGTQFDWAFATSSWTLPSHASLLTGRYPRDHGAEIERFRLPLPTLGAALAADGYRSAAVSANTLAFSRAQGFGGGFGRFDDSFFSVADGLGRTYLTQQIDKRLLLPLGWSDGYFGRRRAEAVNNTALAWIAEDLGRPFFLTLNYFDLHDPYVPPEPWRSRFSSGPEPGGIINSLVGSHGPLTPEQLQREIDAYDGALAYADEQFGRLIDQLDAMGLGSRTLVAVTSDHGESLGLHQLLGHGSSLYAEQIRVPLILRWPGRVPENLRVHEPVSHAGLANTLLELSASPTRLPSAGPAFFGPERLEPMPVLAELAYAPWGGARPTKCGAARALVKSQFHVIAYDDCPAELFDLQADPLEARDLSRTPSYAPVLRELLRLLNELLPSRVSAQDSPVM